MRKFILIAVALLLALVPAVRAETGTIRIDPALPIMLESPAEFEIWVQGAGNPTSDPHILLVMTEASHHDLTGDVVVSWSSGSTSFSAADFTPVTTGFVPPSDTTPGGRYTVASLQDHIGVSHSEMIFYALGPFLSSALTHSAQTFQVTLPSTSPRMLIYAIGKTEGSEIFDAKVPPTIPGFVVPEVAPVLLAAASFGALALYAIKRRKL